MIHNKYLEDIGLRVEQITSNVCGDNDDRKSRWDKQQELYGFDERETWALQTTFVEWLYSHLKMYLDIGGKVVDLDFYTFEYKSEQYTQRKCIEIILSACEKFLKAEDPFWDDDDSIVRDMMDAIKLFADMFPAMWW